MLLAWLGEAGDREIVLRSSGLRCVAIHAGGAVELPAVRAATIVDSTAAGDSFAAAYLAARLASRPIESAVREGHRLAGIVIQHVGAIIPAEAMDSAIAQGDQ